MKTLEITSYIGCPNFCSYCPQELLISTYKGKKQMTMEDFQLILSNTPKDVKIDFTGFSEIFIHPLGSEFIRYSVTSGYETELYTTLFGFKERDVKILKGLNFRVTFHQNDTANLEVFNWKRGIFINEIKFGHSVIIGNETGKTPIISRAGTVFDLPVKYGTYRCHTGDDSKEFTHNVVVPNGDVYFCCMDYGLKHCIGNLFTTNFNDLNRKDVIDASYQYDSDTICRKCEKIKLD